MESENSIAILTKYLPSKLREQLTIEFNNRMSDVNYLLSGRFDYYTGLRNDINTIKLLLSLSIFYKRVIVNFDAATKFSARVTRSSDAHAIQIGTYTLSENELFQLNGVVIRFRKLLKQYEIPVNLFEYLETKEFLKKVRTYRNSIQPDSNA